MGTLSAEASRDDILDIEVRCAKHGVPQPLTAVTTMNSPAKEQPDSIRMSFKVGCGSDTANSKSCAHCTKDHKVCESVPGGVDGNRFELLALLA
ncbi:hypothetical protein PENFLA_c001G10668 [Penicillium flavigenum]|uniref:Uncharacterized protein n=1 Tax=Penicillium flavigenum TaxID=254877 RepID=A0A1V6U2B6_9EURO|nr:hypothetical protein PENFLA_c001G10668 [Penicillium flavigenum]